MADGGTARTCPRVDAGNEYVFELSTSSRKDRALGRVSLEFEGRCRTSKKLSGLVGFDEMRQGGLFYRVWVGVLKESDRIG